MPGNSLTPEDTIKAEVGCLSHAQRSPSFLSNLSEFQVGLKGFNEAQNVDSLPTAAKNKRRPFEKPIRPSPRASHPG